MNVRAGNALPWALIGAGLAAMAALYIISGYFVGLPILAALLIASRFVRWRLPSNAIVQYGLRAILLAAVVMMIDNSDSRDTDPWYLKQPDTNLAGYAVAADFVIRAWSRREPGRVRESLGIATVMSALIFTAATNSYRRAPIQAIAPIYALLVVLTLRDFTTIQQPAVKRRSAAPLLIALRSMAILLTLGAAFAIIFAVTRYENQVTNWAMKFVKPRPGSRPEIGFNASPRLTAVFNPAPSLERTLLVNGRLTEPHLRAVAFLSYSHRQWSPDASSRAYTSFDGGEPWRAGSANALSITRFTNTSDLLPLPLEASAIHSNDPLDKEDAGAVRDGNNGSIAPYDVEDAKSPAAQGPLATAPTADTRAALLAISEEIDPKVIELARQVAGDGEPAKKVF
ncbi:MAG: hypothetical protein JO353_12215, partial [Phycisphaerae bacterium]|nr:hypothetical protein [Phycisphaerae bacterium]